MNKLIHKLQRTGWDVISLMFDKALVYRRRDTFNWYVYITRNKEVLPEITKKDLEYMSIPLLFIRIVPDIEISPEVMSIINKDIGWIPKSNKEGVTYLEIPESWLD